jgi:RNA ligase (TIGR02306 family)
MPSSLIVRCVPIKAVKPHPNADNLVIIELMGWEICTHIDTEPVVGELRVYIPPDAVLPQELAEQLDVVKYLKKGNRVGQIRLRGTMSFGIAASNVWGFKVGEEVSERLGITKYVPPVIPNAGDQETDHPSFGNYSRIENWRNYPDLFKEGNPVILLEKLHGTNSKVGVVDVTDYDNPLEGSYTIQYMIGSHNTRKKMIMDPEADPKKVSLYQYPYKFVRDMLCAIQTEMRAKVVIVYGEIFGRVQDLRYGRNNELAYRAFDIYVDGNFMDWDEAEKWFIKYNVEYVPVVYVGPYSEMAMKDCANQNTLLMPPATAHMSEGVIIRPVKERRDPSIGRVILKYKSDAYEERYARGKGTEYA